MPTDNNSYIIIEVSETNNSYIFKLLENTYRYSLAQIDMLFSKSNKVTISKIKNCHAIREYNSWFVIYPFQSGIPFLFELVDDKEKKGE